MKRLVFAVGVIALGVAALTPARADPLPSLGGQQGALGPWPPGAKYLAVGLKSWGSATMHGKWAMKHHRCKGWS